MDIKFIIWDLDDTLWQGILAEGEQVVLNEHRAELIRAYNKCGLVSAVCSKNDFAQAKMQLEYFNLGNEFVAYRIDFVPKAAVIKQLIEDMQLRPVNVLFVDDNPHNLHEVKSCIPDINILNAAYPDCDSTLQKIFDDSKHIKKSRVDEYRILEAKVKDRKNQNVSNEEFLKSSGIHITFAVTLENLDFKERIVELINRSNQLNYTQSRADIESLTNKMMDIMAYEACSIFVWDKYGYYGLVGFVLIDRHTQIIEHFVFSCRVMHMGIEAAALKKISERHPTPDLSKFKIPLNALSGDWLIEKKFYDPEVRQMIREKENTLNKKEAKIKITYSCMSAGIAYYSKYRDVIDFDGAKFDQPNRYLCFNNLLKNRDEVSTQKIPPALIYGASIDYFEAGWTPDIPLNNENFLSGLYAFCHYFSDSQHKILVVLPPENMPDSCYRQSLNHTRERTEEFNQMWRSVSREFPFITLLELTGFATAADLSDPAHYYAGFLQKIAQRIDAWYDAVFGTKQARVYELLH